MSRLNRTSSSIIKTSIEVPPLRLKENYVPESKQPLNSIKEPFVRLKDTLQNDDAQFLKEKSLYRYTISRKLSKEGLNHSHSQSQFIPPTSSKRHKTQITTEIASNMSDFQNTEKSVVSNLSRESSQKERRFRRKARNMTQVSTGCAPVLQLNNKYLDKSSQSGNQRIKQVYQENKEKYLSSNTETLIEELKKENQILRMELFAEKQQNQRIIKEIERKNRQIAKKQRQMITIRIEKNQLLEDKKRNSLINHQTFINDHKLENQLYSRDEIIKQLQQKIKYIELENATLVKTKSQKCQQNCLIVKLQNRNRFLEKRVDILTKMKTRRNTLNTSMMSECSEVSLNLSAEDEGTQRHFSPQKTLDWKSSSNRGEKTDRKNYKCGDEQTERTQFSPWKKPKLNF